MNLLPQIYFMEIFKQTKTFANISNYLKYGQIQS